MTSQQGYLITYYADSTTVTLANYSIVKATGRGDVVLLLPSGDNTRKDVLHIPSLGFSSLLSLRLIQQSGWQIVFNQPGSGPPNGDFEGADHVMHILNGPDIIATATLIGHGPLICASQQEESGCPCCSCHSLGAHQIISHSASLQEMC